MPCELSPKSSRRRCASSPATSTGWLPALTGRDRDAKRFDHLLTLAEARTDLPEVTPLPVSEDDSEPFANLESLIGEVPERMDLDELQQSLVQLTAEVENALRLEALGASESIHDILWWGDASSRTLERFADDRELFTYLEHVTDALHSSADAESFELTTRTGRTIDGATGAEVRAAFLDLLQAEEPEAEVSVSDARDRSLTLYGTGTLEYVDLETGEEGARDGLGDDEVLALVARMASAFTASRCHSHPSNRPLPWISRS